MPVGWPHSFQFQLHPASLPISSRLQFLDPFVACPCPNIMRCTSSAASPEICSFSWHEDTMRASIESTKSRLLKGCNLSKQQFGQSIKAASAEAAPKMRWILSWKAISLMSDFTNGHYAKKPGADLILQRLHTHALRGSVARLHKQSAVHLCTVHQALWRHPLHATLHTRHCVANEAFMMQTSARNALCKHPLHARHPGCRSRWSLAEIQASLAETRFVLFH